MEDKIEEADKQIPALDQEKQEQVLPLKRGLLQDNAPLWSALIAVSVLLYLLRDLLLNKSEVSSWLAMRICGVQLMIGGLKPYVDFWDWALPTVYDFLKMPCVLRLWMEKLGLFISLNSFVLQFIWFLALTSVLCTAWLFARARLCLIKGQCPQSDLTEDELNLVALPFIFAIALGSLIVRFDLGDLQHLTVLALFPYIFLRWLSSRGLYLGPWTSLIVGAAAGISACFDVPFAAVFIAVELYFVLDARSLRALLRPEVLGFVLAAGVCLVRMSQLEEPAGTAFWKWTMGVRLLNYQIFDEALFAAAASPDRRDICYTMALALSAAFIFKKKGSLLFPLIIVLVTGFGIFILEGQGLSHDLIFTIFANTAVLSILLFEQSTAFARRMFSLKERTAFARLRYPFVLALALLVTVGFGFLLERDRNHLKDYLADQAKGSAPDILTSINKDSKWKDHVLVLSDMPGGAYPALLVLDRSPGGYLLWSRPLRIFEWIKTHTTLEGAMKDFYQYTYSKLQTDLTDSETKFVLVHNYYVHDILDKEKMMRFLEQNGWSTAPECMYYSHNNWQPREYPGLNWSFAAYRRADADVSK